MPRMSHERSAHYGREELADELLAVLEHAFGVDLNEADLRGVDQFHLGGHVAIEALLDGLTLDGGATVLDVGCGIGGVARAIASRFRCAVTAIDLTPEYVRAARALSDRVGAGTGISFEVADALSIPYPDDGFNASIVVHVGMNISDKAALVDELHRVTKPGGYLAIYDIVRLTDAPLTYPLPWTADVATDHIDHADTYVAALAASGLTIQHQIDRTTLVLEAIQRNASDPPPVNLGHLMGPEWPTMFGNLRAALNAGVVAPVEIVAHT